MANMESNSIETNKELYSIITSKDLYDDNDIVDIILKIYVDHIFKNDNKTIRKLIKNDLRNIFIDCEKKYTKMISIYLEHDIPGSIVNKIRNMQKIPSLLEKDDYVDKLLDLCQKSIILKKMDDEYCIL